jgi:hypothetical protein
MGRRSTAELVRRGHAAEALVRPGSESKVPLGCETVAGHALPAATFQDRIARRD